jgi:3-methyladenine DNA glycosylase AlkD
MLLKLKQDLNKLRNPVRAKHSQRFFKTGKGEYGEGDIFLGITMPVQHQLAKKYRDLSLSDLQILLNSKIHEQRMIALLILVDQYESLRPKGRSSFFLCKNSGILLRNKKSKSELKKKIFDFYLSNTKNINNWDLVDLSAPNIVGEYLLTKNKSILYKLAKSKNLWERRIAILATFTFIKDNQYRDALKIGQLLLKDKHDLIHKAVGWMLREIGKRNQSEEEKFLKKYYQVMPRTMLRYAIEKFNDNKRKYYLKVVKS